MDDSQTDIHELSGKSPEFRTQLAKQLEELVPEVVADGKVDVQKLKELLQEDSGDTNERFGLFWPGKKRAMRAAQDPTTATLKPAKDLSKAWDTTQNIFIEGDNLEVLKVLQKQYHNSIKMIYIDPPYNTGKDFVYPDNFKEGLQNYLEFSKQVDEGNKKISTNTETAGRYHSNWLNMMYPRLKLARNLLTDDGVIFVSISDHEVDNLRKVLNEVFGEANFIGQIAVAKGTTTGQDANDIGSSIDYLLVFSRNKNEYKPNGLPLDEKDLARFNQTDDRGRYSTLQFRKTGNNDRREDRPNLYYSLTAPDGSEIYPIGPGGYESRWRTSKKQFNEWEDQDQIDWKKDTEGNYKPYVKYYLEGRTKQVSNYWDDIEGNKKATITVKELVGKDIFTNPKPVGLLKKCLVVSTVDDDIILDFFYGSGTTAHAVMQINAEDGGNRKHIQVQLPEPTDEKSEAYKAGYRKISDIARERINRAGEKIKADYADKLAERDVPLDVGYRTYQLSDTNFRKWQSSATNDLGELQARLDLMRESADDNASEEDLLIEVMLKMGLPLTGRIQQREVAGLSVHQVVPEDEEHADVQPAFYLNEHVKPTLEQLRAIVTELTPSKFVILDDTFQGDNELKTNLVQTCKSYVVELWTV